MLFERKLLLRNATCSKTIELSGSCSCRSSVDYD